MSFPRHIDVYRCSVCSARRELDATQTQKPEVGPPCGELHTEMQRWPDGGFLRTEQWEPHGDMVFVETISGNPLQAVKDAADAVRACRAAAIRG